MADGAHLSAPTTRRILSPTAGFCWTARTWLTNPSPRRFGTWSGASWLGESSLAFFGARTLLDEQTPQPSEWLAVEDQDSLVAAISSVPVDGSVAGCLWKDRDATDILRVVVTRTAP